MADFYTVVTDKGLEALQNCLENKLPFSPTKIAVGDSNGEYYEPSKSQISLKNQKFINNLYAKGKKGNNLYFSMQIPPSEGDYIIREVGLFDNANNLLAIAKYPESYKQKADAYINKSVIVELQFELSTEAINTIIIDDSGNLITREVLQDYQVLNQKGEKDGYAPLDSNAFIPHKHLPIVYNPFCANTGLVENGQPAFLKLENNILSTNGTFDVTTAQGRVYTIKDIVLTLDLTSYDAGEYNLFINPKEKSIKAIKNTIHIDSFFPAEALVGDYLLNTAKMPYDLEEKTIDGTINGLNEVFIGTLKI